jgi:Leucyl aminopeptidase
VKAAARKRGVKATVLGRKEIERERMGGLLAVNRGPRGAAVRDPRAPRGRKGEKPVVLVGKG